MKIHFLGTSDGYPSKERYCSCTVLTVGGKQYVIDAGVPVYSALLHNGYEPDNVGAVCITHMHGDHACGIVEYVNLMMRWMCNGPRPRIFLPTLRGKLAVLSIAEAMDSTEYEPDITVYKEGLIFEDENVKITAYLTGHVRYTYGFLVEGEGKKVYFTADMTGSIDDCPDVVYNLETDMIIHESAHNCLPQIADKLNRMKTKHLVINHVAYQHSIKDFEECKPLINKPFDMAYDGMEIII